MKNYKITVSYDGTRYKGWQIQTNTDATIQGKLSMVLENFSGHPVDVIGSGRTDAGVHALGQVANFHLEDVFKKDEILEYLNRYLPGDIAVTDISEVDDRFHSRYNALRKTYRYRIRTNPVSDVFERRFLYHYGMPLDVDKMEEAAHLLTGTRDFASFCGNKHMKKSTVRTIYEISFQKNKDEFTIFYTGNGFLQGMVRILTGTLIEIGNGKRDIKSIPILFQEKNRALAGFTAPPQGLRLERVVYAE